MVKIIKQRMTADIEGDFVVFLIGMRVNNWWKINDWWPTAMAMPKMLKELQAKPDYGFLGVLSYFGNPTLMVQYWRSFDHLEKYAHDREGVYFPAWAAFYKRVARSGNVGIWHETYLVKSGNYEAFYNNIPAFGLAKVSNAIPVSEKNNSARQRLKS